MMPLTDEIYARLRNSARRIFGYVRCSGCGRIETVPEDDVFEAREELRDEGWIETVPWDGEDRTALVNWHCGCLDPD